LKIELFVERERECVKYRIQKSEEKLKEVGLIIGVYVWIGGKR
jgi:hypothetical protein